MYDLTTLQRKVVGTGQPFLPSAEPEGKRVNMWFGGSNVLNIVRSMAGGVLASVTLSSGSYFFIQSESSHPDMIS